jgi:three-Cys-motif partner protein
LNAEKLAALKTRTSERFPNAKPVFIHGDARTSTGKILEAIPKHRTGFNVLTFCVIDPFNTDNFSFEIIEQLGKRRMDFLVLIPSGMDMGRNIAHYAGEGNVSLDRFLGDPDWREKWDAYPQGRRNADFVVDRFCDRMAQLDYQDSRQFVKPVYVTGTQKLLYHLAFFSQHPRGLDFWKKALKGTNPQTSLLEGL